MKKSKNIKQFVKAILLSIIICYVILNLIGIAQIRAQYKTKMNDYVLPIIQGNITEDVSKADEDMANDLKQQYGENMPTNLLSYAQGYFVGQNEIIVMQEMLIGISVIAGILAGIVAIGVAKLIRSRDNKKNYKNK